MAEPARPTAALTRGRSNWYFATTLANYRTPTVGELTAASTLDFTLMAFRNGTTMPDAEVNRVVAEARLGDDKEFERRGMTKHTGGTLIYALNPQAAAGSVEKKAWETWVDGGSGFLIQRYNVPRAITPALGHFVTVHPVDVSDSIVVPVGDGEAGEVGGKAQYFITDEPAKLVALASN